MKTMTMMPRIVMNMPRVVYGEDVGYQYDDVEHGGNGNAVADDDGDDGDVVVDDDSDADGGDGGTNDDNRYGEYDGDDGAMVVVIV